MEKQNKQLCFKGVTIDAYCECYDCKKKIKDKETVVCFSGGKDSTAMLLHMIELGEKIDHIIFADTGFEYPELYDYIKRVEILIGRKITIVKSKKPFEEWMFGKLTRGKNEGKTRGFPFVLGACYWMREAKHYSIERFLKGKDYVRCIGIANDEKNRVQKGSDIRYPLIEWNWSEQDCVNYLNKKSLLNPLYMNFKRIGCYLCPKQNNYAKWLTWKFYPELWKKIEYYDKENIKICNRPIFITPLKEYTDAWEKGIVPKEPKKYECFECKGLKMVAIGQTKLCNKWEEEDGSY